MSITAEQLLDLEEKYAALTLYANETDNMRLLGRVVACRDTKNHERMVKLHEFVEKAKELNVLQAAHNDGRGITCVRDIVRCLATGSHTDAVLTASHDWDKISNYPDIANWLKKAEIADPSWYVSNQ